MTPAERLILRTWIEAIRRSEAAQVDDARYWNNPSHETCARCGVKPSRLVEIVQHSTNADRRLVCP